MAGAGNVVDGVTTGIGPMKSADCGGGTIWSGVFSTGPDGAAAASSDFRISMAPVSISVAVLAGATGVAPGS